MWYSKALAVVLFVGVAVGSFMLGRQYQRVIDMLIDESTIVTDDNTASNQSMSIAERAKNASYEVEGVQVQFTRGLSRVVLPTKNGSAEFMETRYFGNNASGDLNNDGKEDMVFVLTHSTGGTGVFYYAAALVSDESGYHGTNAVFMGDRIAPQSTDIRDGKADVNYADRGVKEPMTTPPSIGKTLRLVIENGLLVTQ